MKSHKRNARRRNARRVAATTVASGLLAAGALALTTSAASASTLSAQGPGIAYSFRTLDNAKDLTFNQLLGINDSGVIAGYFGSGAQGHPNKGYLLQPQYGQGNYINENFPGSVQTQVTGLNNRGVTVGFWSTMNNANMVNDNFGFVDVAGHFRNADFPTGSPANPPVDQLLGVNGSDEVVGVYTVGSGSTAQMHGFTWTSQHGFSTVDDPHGVGTTTINGVNDHGQLVGFYVDSAGNTDGFLAAP